MCESDVAKQKPLCEMMLLQGLYSWNRKTLLFWTMVFHFLKMLLVIFLVTVLSRDVWSLDSLAVFFSGEVML